MPSSSAPQQMGLPRPGRALKGVLVALFSIWLLFALALNWGDVSPGVFELFCGNAAKILDGEVWRLLTAPLLHVPQGSIGHILGAMLGLYFLGTALEELWGTGRFLRFLAASVLFAYAVQVALLAALPATLSAKLAPEYWYGAMPAVEATAIAWALSFRGRTVRLMFVVPISSGGLVVVVVVLSLMSLIVGATPPSGHIAIFAGMGAGWLFGAGTPSPVRRLYLKFRLRQLDRETQTAQRAGQQRAKAAGFRVIEGGGTGKKKPGKDGGNWLN